MSNSLDLDIEKYNSYDILKLFNCSEKDSEEYIFKKYKTKCESLERIQDENMKINLKYFFDNAFNKLLTFFKKNNSDEKKNRVFKNTPITFKNVNSTIEDTKIMHPSPEINENNTYSTIPIKYPKGILNTIDKKITTEVLCIDTTFRNKKTYSESTDFVYELPNPIENVISMKLINAEIPKNSKLFSKKKIIIG